MVRKVMEKCGSKKLDGFGFVWIDVDVKKLENE